MSDPERVLLIGMMGVGKTTVGRLLADRFQCEHLDSDAQVEARTGRTVPEIFAESGEAAFRAEETRALEEALHLPPPIVVSVAGGAVLDPHNRDLIRGAGRVVWLRAMPATLAARVGSGAGRPLLESDPAGTLARLDAERRPLYAELSDLALDVDDLSPDQILGRIVDWLEVAA